MTDPRIEAAAREKCRLHVEWMTNGPSTKTWEELTPYEIEMSLIEAEYMISAADKVQAKLNEVPDAEDADSLPHHTLILTEQGGYWETIKRVDGKNWFKEPGAPGGGYVASSADLTYPATVIHRSKA